MELSVAFMLILLGVLNLTGVMRKGMDWLAVRGFGPARTACCFGAYNCSYARARADFRSGKRFDVRLGAGLVRRLGLFHILAAAGRGNCAWSCWIGRRGFTCVHRHRQPGWAIGYLLVFGIGTIIGMMLITAAIALPFTYTLKHFARLNQRLAIASGAISVSFGLFLCYQIGISDGLFTGHPNWMPH